MKTARRVRVQSCKTMNSRPSETDVEIAELRQKQKLAIKNNDFETAEEIEAQINQMRENELVSDISAILDEFSQKAADIVEKSFAYIEEIEQQRLHDEHGFRIRINKQFESLKEEQTRALIELERDFAAARLRETERRIPEQEMFLMRAQHAATLKSFQEAKQLRELAQLVAEADLKMRLAKVDDDFESARKVLMSKQREAIESLASQLEAGLVSIRDKARLKVRKEDERRDVKVRTHLSEYQTMFGSTASKEAGDRANEFERTLATILANKGCAAPKGIGDCTKTRPLRTQKSR